MLRRAPFRPQSLQQSALKLSFTTSHRCAGPKHLDAKSEEEHREARTWMSRFNVKNIPKHVCDISFSRASGPGGQTVNKYVCSRLEGGL